MKKVAGRVFRSFILVSKDLPHYLEKLADRIKIPDLIICLDSGCGDYDHLWVTTSLRGSLSTKNYALFHRLDIVMTVKMLEEGVHSGEAGGISNFLFNKEIFSS